MRAMLGVGAPLVDWSMPGVEVAPSLAWLALVRR